MFGTNDLEVPLVGAEDVAYSQPLSDGHHACIHEIQVDVSVGMEEFNAATDVCRKKVSNFQRALLEAIQAGPHRPMPKACAQKIGQFYEDDIGKQQMHVNAIQDRKDCPVMSVGRVKQGIEKTRVQQSIHPPSRN